MTHGLDDRVLADRMGEWRTALSPRFRHFKMRATAARDIVTDFWEHVKFT